MVRNGYEYPLIIVAPIFVCCELERGRENEIDIIGYRERNISIMNMSIMIGNR